MLALWTTIIVLLFDLIWSNKVLCEKFPRFLNTPTLHQRHHSPLGTADSCILISMITFFDAVFPLSLCVRARDFYMSPDRLQIPFRFEKSSKLLLGKQLATIINLQQEGENSKWHANLSWCPFGPWCSLREKMKPCCAKHCLSFSQA